MRALKWLLVAASLVGAAGPGGAQEFPNRPVRIIAGFVPSSSTDIIARLMASQWSKALGQQFVVENRPGAASAIAADLVARSPKDGHTLLVGGTVNLTTRPDQSAAGLRHPARLHAGDRRRRTADDPDSAPFRRRQQCAGADRAGEVEARRTALWLDRRRRQSASADRTVLGADRHQDDARALSGQPAGHHRPAGRPHSPDAFAGRGCAAAHRLRRAQGRWRRPRPGVRHRCRTCRP